MVCMSDMITIHSFTNAQGLIVQRLDSPIHRINPYSNVMVEHHASMVKDENEEHRGVGYVGGLVQ